MEINKEIIQRYHLGLCSPKEAAAIEEWLNSEEVEMTFLNEEELNELENKTWQDISRQQGITPLTTPPKFNLSGFNWQIAAGIAIILGLTIAYVFFSSNSSHKVRQEVAQLHYKNIRTKKGEKLQVVLPDDTRVWLNSESSLRFPIHFAGNQRNVSFTGEAYFAVAKDPDKPFRITSNRVAIQVLGTRFNLRDYTNESYSSVVVEEGKVRFSGVKSAKNIILTANQKGTYKANSNPELATTKVYGTSKYLGWKDNKLVLDNLNLQEILPILERWYGVELTLADSTLASNRYTGSFDNPNLKEVIESICFALKINYQQRKDIWIINK